MRYIADDFIEEAERQCISYNEIGNEEALVIRNTIEQKYCKKNGRPLWERIKVDTSGIHSPSNKNIFNDLNIIDEIFVFFEEDTDKTIFKLNNINELIKIVNELFGFIFYVTNYDEDFLLCWNDHEFIIGAGIAKQWIEDLKNHI